MQKRKSEIALFSLLMCVLVIFIHVTSWTLTAMDRTSVKYLLLLFPWRLSAFVVQGFVFLSGVRLFLSEKPFAYGRFLRGRVRRPGGKDAVGRAVGHERLAWRVVDHRECDVEEPLKHRRDARDGLLHQRADLPPRGNIRAVFAEHGVSIRSVLQRGKGEEAQLVLVTHLAREGAVQQVLAGLRGLPVVGNLASAMRVEGEEADEVLGW
mgnify:CR=1 FL=1